MVKVERTFPGPASLMIEAKKLSGNYAKQDVIEQLKKDFHNKCYICEMNDLQDPEVEHLLPHKNGRYPERKFDWNNLFWACGHCNKVKNQSKYEAGILDCCQHDPEERINFRLKEGQTEVTAKDKKDSCAVLTPELVYEVFNIKNTGVRIYKSAVRLEQLTKEMNLLYDNLEKLKKYPDSRAALRKLGALLRRESKFAAFKRCFVRENIEAFPQLSMFVI